MIYFTWKHRCFHQEEAERNALDMEIARSAKWLLEEKLSQGHVWRPALEAEHNALDVESPGSAEWQDEKHRRSQFQPLIDQEAAWTQAALAMGSAAQQAMLFGGLYTAEQTS